MHIAATLCSLSLFLIVSQTVAAQDQAPPPAARNNVYVELGGKSPFYSVNYERVLLQRPRMKYALGVGFGYTAGEVSVPLSLTALTGRGNHHADFSLALTPSVQYYLDHNVDKVMYVVPGFGYRYQKPTGGFLVGVGLTPSVFVDPPSDNVLNASTRSYLMGKFIIGWSY